MLAEQGHQRLFGEANEAQTKFRGSELQLSGLLLCAWVSRVRAPPAINDDILPKTRVKKQFAFRMDNEMFIMAF